MMILSLSSLLLCVAGVLAQENGPSVPAACSTLPASVPLPNQLTVLPDPFTFLNGTKVTTRAAWDCRAAQIRALFQTYELGTKPPRPPVLTSTTSVSGSTTTLTITAGLSSSQTISWSVNIVRPAGVSTSTRIPAIIAYGGLSLPAPSGAATINFDNSAMGQQNSASSRGQGLFYNLYGRTASAGSLMSWAWGVSRIIDALEAQPSLGIDTTRIAVTGCSRNGKGAIVAGAFDQRIALTIPQESGSGGDSCWRTSRDMLVNQGISTQEAQEIVGENDWLSTSFNQFASSSTAIGALPVDHHELAGLVAPRGLYSTGNVGFTWLGDWSTWECMNAANRIFQALGVQSNQGFSQDASHPHCAWPADQTAELTAFYDRFLFGRNVATNVFRTAGRWSFIASWVPWTTPTLL